jgi:hypothetical protein
MLDGNQSIFRILITVTAFSMVVCVKISLPTGNYNSYTPGHPACSTGLAKNRSLAHWFDFLGFSYP